MYNQRMKNLSMLFSALLCLTVLCVVLAGCQPQKDCETVTAFVTDINTQDNTVTVQDTNGEIWHFDNQKAEYNSVFTITYNPSDWELLDYSVQ